MGIISGQNRDRIRFSDFFKRVLLGARYNKKSLKKDKNQEYIFPPLFHLPAAKRGFNLGPVEVSFTCYCVAEPFHMRTSEPNSKFSWTLIIYIFSGLSTAGSGTQVMLR